MTVAARTVWFVVPDGIDDPARVSGGNAYDRRLREQLAALGWVVHTREIDADATPDALADLPADALVLVDGLVGVRSPHVVEAASDRVRVVVLAHMVVAADAGADPPSIEAERRTLRCARRVITTSEWARGELVERGLVAADRVSVAVPGTDEAPLARGTESRGSMLCVGAVVPHKGQDTVVDALAALEPQLRWSCTMTGSLTTDRAFSARVTARAAEAGLSERISWTGVLTGPQLDAAYGSADLLVAPSRAESYGMAVAEALRRGIPVVASRVGGIPEAVAPGAAAMLVPPGRPDELSAVLRRWITDPALRARLTEAARRDAASRPSWISTAEAVDEALAVVS